MHRDEGFITTAEEYVMSTKQTVMGPRGPEKIPGFFSWRHATRDEHGAARERYLSEHGPAARRRKAAEREAALLHVMRERGVDRREALRLAKVARLAVAR